MRAAVLFARGNVAAAQVAARGGVALARTFLTAARRARLRNTVLDFALAATAVFAIGLSLAAILVRGAEDRTPASGAPQQVHFAPGSDVEKIQGRWKAVRVAVNGEELRDGGSTMSFTRNGWDLDCKIVGGPANDKLPAMFQLDPTQTPKAIDFIFNANQMCVGIYELQGDTLKICFPFGSADRPVDFTSRFSDRYPRKDPTVTLMMYELRRE
jgi:uncharacterized protein (TIGR03067 family)